MSQEIFEIIGNDLGHKVIQRFKYEIIKESEKAIFVKIGTITEQPSQDMTQIGYGKFWIPKSMMNNTKWISMNKFIELEAEIVTKTLERVPQEYHSLIKELLL